MWGDRGGLPWKVVHEEGDRLWRIDVESPVGSGKWNPVLFSRYGEEQIREFAKEWGLKDFDEVKNGG